MTPTGQVNELATALCKAQAQMRAAPKSKSNPHFKSRYADLDACWDAAREALTTHGLSVVQGVSAQGKAVTVTTMLMHTSGQWLASDLTLEADKATAQSVGSAITYARRYAFSAMVGITSDEDDDGNAAVPPPPPKGAPVYEPEPPVEIPFAPKAGTTYEGTDEQKAFVAKVFEACGKNVFHEAIKGRMREVSQMIMGDDMGTIEATIKAFLAKG